LVRGLATSLRASAVKSSDVFAESLVLYACAEPLLAILDDPAAAETAQQPLDEAAHAQAQARRWMLKALKDDRFALLSDGNGMADLYFLPLRLSRIFGWLAVGIEVDRLSGRSDAAADREVENLANVSDAEGNPLSDLSRSSRSISPTERSDESSRLKMAP
jgi:hypothetical protein